MSEVLSTLAPETPETIRLNEIRNTQTVDTQMLDSLRVKDGVLQCRVKVQEYDGWGYPVSMVMWDWCDVEVLNTKDKEGE